MYTKEKNKKNKRKINLNIHKNTLDKENRISAKKEGKGGAERVKKKDKTIKKAKNGEKHRIPRIIICWRVEKKRYVTPTNINIRGELIPCKNIILIIPFNLKWVEANNIIGTLIIWETEE